MSNILYLARNGETFANLEERIGGNSDLTKIGIYNAKKLAGFFQKEVKHHDIKFIYTAMLKRTMHTAEIISKSTRRQMIIVDALDDIRTGSIENIKWSEFKRDHLDLYIEREKDKYHWSYPQGESYEDVMNRVAPFIDSLKGENIIIGTVSINRCILGHIFGLSKNQIPELIISTYNLYKIDLDDSSCSQIFYKGNKLPIGFVYKS